MPQKLVNNLGGIPQAKQYSNIRYMISTEEDQIVLNDFSITATPPEAVQDSPVSPQILTSRHIISN
jgi:hypothetical protein